MGRRLQMGAVMGKAARARTGLAARVRQRMERASLASVFIAYLVVYLAGATGLTVVAITVLEGAYTYAWEQQMPVHVYNGPYLYDAERGDLVPAASIEVGDYTGDVSLYLGIDADDRAAAETQVNLAGSEESEGAGVEAAEGAGEGGAAVDGVQEVYATLEMIAEDPALTVSDWGGNFVGSYDENAYEELLAQGGDNILAEALPAYDAYQRSVRAQVDGSAIGLSLESDTPTSNVAYYVSQSMDFTPLVAALRFMAGMAPFVIYGVMAWLVFRRFYRRRLAEPLGALVAATDRVAVQDLDFTVPAVPGRELGRLAAAFERMRASLADAQRRMWRTAEERKRLNAAFAHDLRTPLTVLKGTVEMAQLRLEEGSAAGSAMPGAADSADGQGAHAAGEKDAARMAEARRTLATLGAQVTRLQRYAEVMSSASKLEDRAVRREPVKLAAFARDLADEAAALVAASPQELGFSCSLTAAGETWKPLGVDGSLSDGGEDAGVPRAIASLAVDIDGALVAEAVGNLLSNARGHAASKVGLALSYADGMLSCTVSDDGPGFTAEALRRGCEPFYSEAKSAEHFGMGLNIAHVLADLHGGAVELANADPPDHGARVTARFSCGEPSAGAGA